MARRASPAPPPSPSPGPRVRLSRYPRTPGPSLGTGGGSRALRKQERPRPRTVWGGLHRFSILSLRSQRWVSTPTPPPLTPKRPQVRSDLGKRPGAQVGQRPKGVRKFSFLQSEEVALLRRPVTIPNFFLLGSGREAIQMASMPSGQGWKGPQKKLSPLTGWRAGRKLNTRPDGPCALGWASQGPPSAPPASGSLLESSASLDASGPAAPPSPEVLRALEPRREGGNVGGRPALGTAGEASAAHGSSGRRAEARESREPLSRSRLPVAGPSPRGFPAPRPGTEGGGRGEGGMEPAAQALAAGPRPPSTPRGAASQWDLHTRGVTALLH